MTDQEKIDNLSHHLQIMQGWAEALLRDIEVGAVRYEDGTTWEDEYIDDLKNDIKITQELINSI